MSTYMSRTFWLGVCERAVKTLAQTMLAMLTLGSTIWGFDWVQIVGVGLTAVAYSVLTSLADPTGADMAKVRGVEGVDDEDGVGE